MFGIDAEEVRGWRKEFCWWGSVLLLVLFFLQIATYQNFFPVFFPVIHLKSVRRLGIENEQSLATESIHEEMGEEVAREDCLLMEGENVCEVD